MKTILPAVTLALAGLAAPASAAAPTIAAAIADPARPAADKELDAARKPAEMLKFLRLKPGMTVVDLLPGGGYFTRLFSDMVGPTGKVIAYVPDEMLKKSTRALDNATKAAEGRPNVQIVHDPLMSPSPANMADVVWTAQNYHDLHNMPGVDLVAYNRLVLTSLKPGGIYVVLDHAAPAGSGLTATNTTHRIDPEAVKQEVVAAGFVFDGETKVLANPADTKDKNVFDPSIRHKTDQFVYRFRKPAGGKS